jgi:hypothetical protein
MSNLYVVPCANLHFLRTLYSRSAFCQALYEGTNFS